jgi:hypothetical protein
MTPSQERKNKPAFSGVLMYFPDAIMAIAEHSKKANDKHNPGEPLHWSKEKSKDHADCIARHLIDIGPSWDAKDEELGSLHATALAWRALALLQMVLERKPATTETPKFDIKMNTAMKELAQDLDRQRWEKENDAIAP